MTGCWCNLETWHWNAKSTENIMGFFIAFFSYILAILRLWMWGYCMWFISKSNNVNWKQMFDEKKWNALQELFFAYRDTVIYSGLVCWRGQIHLVFSENRAMSFMCFCQCQHSKASVPMRHTNSNALQTHLFILILFRLCMIIGYWVNI